MTIEETITRLQKLVDLNKDRVNGEEALGKAVKTMESAVEYLKVYPKALDMACEEIAKSHPILSALGYDYYKDRYLQKARDEA